MTEPDVLTRDLLVINAALAGMVPTKSDSPHIPISPTEIAHDVEAVAAAGAAVVHIHPRDEAGRPTTDPDIYARVIAAVRERCPDIIISATCSGRLESDIDRRATALALEDDLKPDMGSLTCGSMNFPRQASVNAPEDIVELATRMHDRGIKPEVEVFEPGMLHFARVLLSKGVLEGPLYVNILLGNLGTSPASAFDLSHMVAMLPEDATWAAAGIGRFQLTANALALAMGGHVRVGLEDNLYYDWHERGPATNAMLVERVVRIAAELGRRPATVAEARAIIGLPARSATQ
jgi:3-keto-5-aminohexanoate cleavage enzyme